MDQCPLLNVIVVFLQPSFNRFSNEMDFLYLSSCHFAVLVRPSDIRELRRSFAAFYFFLCAIIPFSFEMEAAPSYEEFVIRQMLSKRIT